MGLEALAGVLAGTSAGAGELAAAAPFGAAATAGAVGLGSGGGSGKGGGGGGLPVATVSAQPAINYFMQAAQAYQTNAQAGLQYYNNYMQEAQQTINNAYSQANTTLSGLSYDGTEATNKYMQMIGLNPQPATANDPAQLLGIDPGATSIANDITNAESIQDPTARQQSLYTIDSGLQGLVQQNQQQITSLAPKASEQWTGYTPTEAALIGNGGNTWGVGGNGGNGTGGVAGILNSPEMLGFAGVLDSQQAINADNQNIAAQNQANATTAGNLSTENQQLTNFLNTYDNQYTATNGQFAYTGDQVAQQLESTPGYEFQLGQGEQALMANNAASGLLNSGNTLAGITRYGQQYAQNAYQGYLQNLQQIMGPGNAATAQISSNQINQGTDIANTQQSLGNAYAQTYNNIGNAWMGQLGQSGQTTNQDAIFNAQQQNQMTMALLNSQTSQSNAATAANTSMSNQAQQSNTANGYLNLAQANFVQNTQNSNAQGAGYGYL
jgi:hypothetical protein